MSCLRMGFCVGNCGLNCWGNYRFCNGCGSWGNICFNNCSNRRCCCRNRCGNHAIAATIVVTAAQINVETAGAEVIVDAEIIVVTDRVREHSFIFYRLGGFPALPDPPFSCNELLSQNLLDECNKYRLFLCILSYL